MTGPAVGTAHVCRALGLGTDSLRLEMQAGIVPVAAKGNRWALTAPAPTWRELEVTGATLARALGLEQKDIGERPLWVRAGREQLMVPLLSPDAVLRASPQIGAIADIQSEDGMGMIYVFAASGAPQTLARFFFPQGSAMLEDPATGSAAANFGAWCLAMERQLPVRCAISQGEMIARPSTLYLDIGIDRHIRVSGDVIEIAAGAVTLN